MQKFLPICSTTCTWRDSIWLPIFLKREVLLFHNSAKCSFEDFENEKQLCQRILDRREMTTNVSKRWLSIMGKCLHSNESSLAALRNYVGSFWKYTLVDFEKENESCKSILDRREMTTNANSQSDDNRSLANDYVRTNRVQPHWEIMVEALTKRFTARKIGKPSSATIVFHFVHNLQQLLSHHLFVTDFIFSVNETRLYLWHLVTFVFLDY